jgi:hypothetical protein
MTSEQALERGKLNRRGEIPQLQMLPVDSSEGNTGIARDSFLSVARRPEPPMLAIAGDDPDTASESARNKRSLSVTCRSS